MPGVFSHETALVAHGLAELLPSRVHLTLPLSWKRRRLRLPAGVELHFDDLSPAELGANDGLPYTTVARTLRDCEAARIAPRVMKIARLVQGARRPARPPASRRPSTGSWRMW